MTNAFLTGRIKKQAPTLLSANTTRRAPDAAQREHMAPEWQAAMEALILVATLGGPTMFARIASC